MRAEQGHRWWNEGEWKEQKSERNAAAGTRINRKGRNRAPEFAEVKAAKPMRG